ncbi:MAG: nucleotidyltransferase domain-containing protein, partial [Candidatus Aenigmatarchaeota archaeon]
FGSRARGDYREDSDYDLLIVTKEKLDRKIYKSFYSKIVKELAKHKIFGDFIIVSKKYFEERKDKVEDISYYALREGILI